jgi:hypothetical protein
MGSSGRGRTLTRVNGCGVGLGWLGSGAFLKRGRQKWEGIKVGVILSFRTHGLQRR